MTGPENPLHAWHGEGDHAQRGGGAISSVKQARALRRTMTLPEVLLWQRLRKRAGGIKFRRQHPVAGYLLDFYCPEAKLAIEIDGQAHSMGDRPTRDARRDARLSALGLTIVRLPAAEVLQNIDAAVEAVVAMALPLHRPAGGPPPHAWHEEDHVGAQ